MALIYTQLIIITLIVNFHHIKSCKDLEETMQQLIDKIDREEEANMSKL
jgi:hypothetical protein